MRGRRDAAIAARIEATVEAALGIPHQRARMPDNLVVGTDHFDFMTPAPEFVRHRGALTESCKPTPIQACRVKIAACVCGWPSPPIVPYTITRPSARRASAGFSVWKGLRPGRRTFNARSSREKLHPRFCQLMPVPASTMPLPNS